MVEGLALVVIAQTADNSGAVPGLDRVGAGAEQTRHLGGGEHAGGAQSLAAAAEPVGVDDVVDHLAVEPFSGAGGDAALVEDVGDLATDVVVEQVVDGGDDFGGCFALFANGFGGGQGEGCVGAAGESDVRGDGVAVAVDGDVGEQQPGDAFAFPRGGGGVVPDCGQVGDELVDAGVLGGGELSGVLFAGFVVGLSGRREVRVGRCSSRLRDCRRRAGWRGRRPGSGAAPGRRGSGLVRRGRRGCAQRRRSVVRVRRSRPGRPL